MSNVDVVKRMHKAFAGPSRVKDGRIVQFRQFADTARIAGATRAAGKEDE